MPVDFQQVRRFLHLVKTPGRYVGGEPNQVVKDHGSVAVRVALCYPDVYELGMSHQGLRILYGLVNERSDALCERAFAPWPDMEARMRRHQVPLYGLETRTALREFDILGFTLMSELTYSNVLAMIDLAGIPLRGRARGLEHPLVIAGGHCAHHPEPLAEFIDLFVIGDGEAGLTALIDAFKEERPAARSREDLLLALARRLPFAYVPRCYEPRYRDDGLLAEIRPVHAGVPAFVKPAAGRELDETYFPTRPVVPLVRTTHDRIAIEIMRGCVQACRFCQAGYIRRPLRFRSPQRVLELARESFLNTGCDEIALTSLSSSDHPHLRETMELLFQEFAPRRVGLSLPSLRVDEQVKVLPRIIKTVRKSGLTLAPEVASDRLRRVINKNIKNQHLYDGARAAWAEGWQQIKIYTMCGIPTETDADLAEIVDMAEHVSLLARESGKKPGRVVAAVSILIPKPWTAFQWHGMPAEKEVLRKQRFLLSRKRLGSVRLNFHKSDQTILEEVLGRGDRRVGDALERAVQMGCRFDGWDDQFRWDLWQEAFRTIGLDPHAHSTRPRPLDEVFPWDHVGASVTKEHLREEYQKSLVEGFTPECQFGKCSQCGLPVKECVDIKRDYARRSGFPVLPPARRHLDLMPQEQG